MPLPTWMTFFVAAWLISLSPGPGAVSCMASGLKYGWRRARWNIFGLQAGLAIDIAIVGAGLGALLAASNLAFNLVKWFGVAYLIYLGLRQWRHAASAMQFDVAAGEQGAASRWALFRQGLLVNVSNPKGIVFLLAVLPQFIDPKSPQFSQYLVAGATLIGTDLIVMHGYTALAASILKFMRSPRQRTWMNRSFGGLFVGAGALLATFQRAQ